MTPLSRSVRWRTSRRPESMGRTYPKSDSERFRSIIGPGVSNVRQDMKERRKECVKAGSASVLYVFFMRSAYILTSNLDRSRLHLYVERIMHRFSPKNIAVVLLAALLCVSFLSLSHGAENAKRGHYPQCQDNCLAKLEKRMADLSENYKKTGLRLVYEDSVEQARAEYDECIAACKQPLPVK